MFDPISTSTTISTNPIWGPIGVARFEIIRSLSVGRLVTWGLMALFPVALVVLLIWTIPTGLSGPNAQQRLLGFTITLFLLLPIVQTILSLLLWATPVISAELEGQTWIYSSVRPGGRIATVLGKYAVAVLWTASAGIVSATLAVPLIGFANGMLVWWTLVKLIIASSFAYGALYLAIGTLAQKRAMALAFVYTLIVEVVLSWVPATVNQLTVGYRLRSLFVGWLQIDTSQVRQPLIFGGETAEFHLSMLGVYTLVMVAIAIGRANWGEYSLHPEAP